MFLFFFFSDPINYLNNENCVPPKGTYLVEYMNYLTSTRYNDKILHGHYCIMLSTIPARIMISHKVHFLAQ